MSPGAKSERDLVQDRVADVFGGGCSVAVYSDMAEENWMNIVWKKQRNNLISFGTVGVSSYQSIDRQDPPLGVEMVGISERENFSKVLVDVGLYAVKNRKTLEPGTVITNVITKHLSDLANTPHLLLLEPFSWNDEDFEPLILDQKTVAWLQAVSISDAEVGYLDSHNLDALEDLFMDTQPDFFDLHRDSVV